MGFPAKPIDAELMRRTFRYDVESGKLYWRLKRSGKSIGAEVGWIERDGYVRLELDAVKYKAHRIVWAMANGDVPSNIKIDHIDGCRSNNTLGNLRIGTHSQNLQNRTKLNRNNTSGVNGVCFSNVVGKYRAVIQLHGSKIFLGYFNSVAEAERARWLADLKYYPFSQVNLMRSTIEVTF